VAASHTTSEDSTQEGWVDRFERLGAPPDFAPGRNKSEAALANRKLGDREG
jgi:hypothetical protein